MACALVGNLLIKAYLSLIVHGVVWIYGLQANSGNGIIATC